MLGSSKRRVFQPTAYGHSRRRSRRIPRWLLLILAGIVLGAGGLLFLQKSYGPPRLTVEQSEQLHYDLNSANIEKQRLQSLLNQQGHTLKETQTELAARNTAMSQVDERIATLQKDIDRFARAMPPDPRGTSPGIRAARFRSADGQLFYELLVMQDDPGAAPFEGQVELVAAGRTGSRAANLDLDGFTFDVGHYAHLEGAIPLPPGFTPRQITVRIINQANKRLAATRTLNVQP